MRLRGCVAIELSIGALVSAAIGGAAFWGVRELRGALAEEGAVAPTRVAYAGDEREPPGGPGAAPRDDGAGPRLAAASINGELMPRSEAAAEEPRSSEPAPATAKIEAAPTAPDWTGTGQFLGQRDDALLAPLRDAPIKAVKLNRGGSSLSLRIDFANGARAACKPNQIHMHSQPRREIAAYRVNRLLGLSSVAPTIGRRFRVAEIADRFRADARRDRARYLAELVADRDDTGSVLSQLTWWIPALNPALIDGFQIDSVEGVVTWKRYLTVGNTIPEAAQSMAAQISTLILFDFIINNSDRWSGGNIKSSEDPNVLVFLDNTLSFGGDPNGHNRVRTYLLRSQKFSRTLVDRLRQIDDGRLEVALTRDIDPFPLLLEKYELRALGKRRDFALRYIDELIAKHGEAAVLAFP